MTVPTFFMVRLSLLAMREAIPSYVDFGSVSYWFGKELLSEQRYVVLSERVVAESKKV